MQTVEVSLAQQLMKTSVSARTTADCPRCDRLAEVVPRGHHLVGTVCKSVSTADTTGRSNLTCGVMDCDDGLHDESLLKVDGVGASGCMMM